MTHVVASLLLALMLAAKSGAEELRVVLPPDDPAHGWIESPVLSAAGFWDLVERRAAALPPPARGGWSVTLPER